jgi:hypothetical protein
MRALLMGFGEIGKGVYEVFQHVHEIHILDPKYPSYLPVELDFDILLVAIPYSDHFVEAVTTTKEQYNIDAAIIFSTVAIGTTSKIPGAVHSPVEGKHPHLATSIRKMERWVGGESPKANFFFRKAGINPKVVEKPEFTEFLKLRSTSLYGVNIEFARYSKQVCDDLGMDFHFVQAFDVDYNELYQNLGMPQYQRYILDAPEGVIGGHCIVGNSKILDAQYPSVFLKEIHKEGV